MIEAHTPRLRLDFVRIPADASIDVIFVHGIAGDPILTWTSSAGYWPDWLAETNQSARVSVLGYDHKISLFGKALDYRQLAQSVLELLTLKGVGERPLVFVAHSFGGLLVQEILRTSSRSNTEKQKNAFRHCLGVVLLSTPLQSLKFLASLALSSVFRTIPREQYMRDVNEWYRQTASNYGISTLVFAAMNDSILDASSAEIGIPDTVPIYVQARHYDICKPDSRHSLVVLKVQDFIENLEKVSKSPERKRLPRADVSDGSASVSSRGRLLGNTGWYECRQNRTVIVFVHGVLSGSDTCWLDVQSRTFWPDLIHSDPRIGAVDTFMAGYYTEVDSGPWEIRDAADWVMRALKRKDSMGRSPVMTYDNIVFVAHSLGGVVVRYLLHANRELFRSKKIGLVLYASPSFGSALADRLGLIASYFKNSMGQQLRWGSWSLEELDNNFKEMKQQGLIPNLHGAEAIENRFVIHYRWLPFFRRTLVVTKESGGRYFGAARIMPGTDHFTIVKPTTAEHCSHLFLVDFLADNNFLREPDAAAE